MDVASKKRTPERLWHIWLFFFEEKRFLYGFTAPSYHPLPSSPHRVFVGHDSIVEYHTGLTSEQFVSFKEKLSSGLFSTAVLDDGVPDVNIEIKFHQRCLQNTLGCSAVQVDTYYSMLLEEYDVSQEGVKHMMSHLWSANSFAVPENYMHRLGAFDVINLPEYSEDDQYIVDFRLPEKRDSSKLQQRNAYEIWRREDFSQDQHWAHTCLYSGDTPVSDTLHLLESGKQVLGPITVDEPFDRVEFRLFDKNGLLHHEDSTWMNQLSLDISVGHGTLEYTSPLIRRGTSVDTKKTATSLKHVHIRSRDMTNTVNMSTGQEFRKYCREMRERGKTLFQSPSPDRWFPKGVAGSLGALQHLKTLFEGHDVSKCWIVDPFFDARAAENLIPVIGVSTLELAIITNLRNVLAYRETGDSACEINPVSNLKKTLGSLKKIIHCHVTVKNIRAAPDSDEQVFHDRYVSLKKQDGNTFVYLLSNSLNAYAENYPFCMSLLSGPAAENVHDYIIKLENLTNPATGTVLHCDLNWSK
ncbi:MAG: hypothetical protein LBU75_04035 [Desulfovibrio sp.]|jgi:hypothetical protein|nr:hypothetical protein [Desulfovibrio sp.]